MAVGKKKRRKEKRENERRRRKKKNKNKIKTEASGLSNAENMISHQKYQQKVKRLSLKEEWCGLALLTLSATKKQDKKEVEDEEDKEGQKTAGLQR